jgi:hypothetical protein
MSNKTIVYYTANKESDSFEKKVRKNILKASKGIPIISVSQKPIRFGHNICVGEMEHGYKSAFKQALIGVQAAKTPFVIMCESDCLYPKKGYFDFEPEELDTIYTYDNVWLMWDREQRTRFYKHGTTCGSIILGRDFYINLLKDGPPDFFQVGLKWQFFTGDPIINIKTRDGVSFGTTLTKGVKPQKSFKQWGTVEDIKKKYL